MLMFQKKEMSKETNHIKEAYQPYQPSACHTMGVASFFLCWRQQLALRNYEAIPATWVLTRRKKLEEKPLLVETHRAMGNDHLIK